jgi:eukaryotic-like serine/threonine-protein kinase
MGEVYRARDARIARDVAIKILPSTFVDDRERLLRFEQEARAAGALNHPNLLTIYELGMHDGVPFIATELLEGETLRARLRIGPLPLSEAVDYALQIANGLAAAHQKGIVHRDLKPENLFVTEDGRVKILDFGLAKTTALLPADAPTALRLTDPGTLLGTVQYMSPEQVRSDDLDARSDLFSLGVVLYELVSGRSPFIRASAPETMVAILRDDPQPLDGDVPPWLVTIIRHCLEKNTAQRFQSAHDVGLALSAGMTSGITTDARPELAQARAPRWIAGALLTAALIALIAVRFRERVANTFSPQLGPRIDSVAVLPLANLSGDPQQQYFADGMTEELITQLAQIGALRVISRASVMEYRDTKKSASQIAQELHVRALVTGSVLRSATRVRITAQLIDAETSSSVWADQYERELGDVLALQNEVARSIEERIKVKVTPQVASRLAAVRSVDPRAYELFLKGRFYSRKNTPDGLNRGLSYFEDAVRRDPRYAPAFAGIAYCYNQMGHFQILLPQDAYPNAKKASEKALQLDPGSADAHMSLAWAKASYDWDWPSAEREFRTAIRLNPNDAMSHDQYALCLAAQGRHVEAVAEASRGVNVDPVSRTSLTGLAWVLYLSRRYDASLGQYQKALEVDSNGLTALENVADLYEAMGDHARAFDAYQRWAAAAGITHSTIMKLDRAFHAQGMNGYWQTRLQMEKNEEAEEGEAWPYRMAALNARVGDREEAINWLQRAYAERNSRLIFLGVDPVFDGIRSDPRVVQILRGVGIAS